MTQKRIEELEAKLAEIQNEIEELKKPKIEIPRPEEGAGAILLLHDGRITSVEFHECHDLREVNQGNIFWGENAHERAKEESRRRYIKTKLKAYTKGFVPDWNHSGKDKFRILYDGEYKNLCISEVWTIQHMGEIYFATKEDAQLAIDEMGDELKELFEV